MPEFTAVESSNLAGIAFVEGEGLFIEFKRGTVYRYPEATAEVHDALLAESTSGGSIGRAFKSLVKDAGLAYEVVQ